MPLTFHYAKMSSNSNLSAFVQDCSCLKIFVQIVMCKKMSTVFHFDLFQVCLFIRIYLLCYFIVWYLEGSKNFSYSLYYICFFVVYKSLSSFVLFDFFKPVFRVCIMYVLMAVYFMDSFVPSDSEMISRLVQLD